MDSILNGFVAATATATFLIMASILANSGGAIADCTPLLSSDPSSLDDSCKILFMRRQTEIPFGSKARHFKWEVEYMFGTPDCMEHGLMGINGQFPGPSIRAKAGDTISVEVTNKLHTEGFVIHWHGITQLGTAIPWADGTASVSQYTINPGETFLYRFKVNQAGSYFFHGHFWMQRSARLYGSLIVDVGAKPFIRQSRKLLNDEEKELGESKAGVRGSVSEPSPSE